MNLVSVCVESKFVESCSRRGKILTEFPPERTSAIRQLLLYFLLDTLPIKKNPLSKATYRYKRTETINVCVIKRFLYKNRMIVMSLFFLSSSLIIIFRSLWLSYNCIIS